MSNIKALIIALTILIMNLAFYLAGRANGYIEAYSKYYPAYASNAELVKHMILSRNTDNILIRVEEINLPIK
jgi:hypothetical protein